MKRFRKCDTTKYRRHREREKVAHTEHVERRRKEEMIQARLAREELDRYLKVRNDYRRQEQALVNVLARRLYQLSPEHAADARFREFLQMTKFIAKEFLI
ncbi:unnamed protein product [marine sediment metagenome]|uniref:Uncharacterized protein n=1 Tax=marine sediment metagenome TaxID=412755 RepID=X1KLE4_9ZZZZ